MQRDRGRPSLVIMPFLGSHIGGSHVSGFALGDALCRFYGMDCVVICPSPSAIADEARRKGFAVIPSGEAPTYRHSLSYDLRRLVSRIGIAGSYRSKNALIHCNDMQALKSWGPVAKLIGLPLIYHHRSLNSMTFLKRRVLSLPDYAICISNACSKNLSCSDRRIMILDPIDLGEGINRISARESLAEEFGIDRDARLIGFVANFWHRKRPFFFLDVCARLASQAEAFHGMIFGRAGEIQESELRTYADGIGLSHRITFAGFRLPPERNVAALDLLLAPALDEPFGRTLVEALLWGVPYVATSSAGHAEIHYQWSGGRLVSERANAAEFASIASRVLRDPSGIVLTGPQRDSAQQELSSKRHADNVVRIYETVMAHRGSLAVACGQITRW
jgi:glycosyltransferase involved in cell wall biosynthesis